MATSATCVSIPMTGNLNPPNVWYSPYSKAVFASVYIGKQGDPLTTYFFELNNPINYNTSLDPSIAQAQALVALLTSLAAIPPDAEGTWNGVADAASVMPVTSWAWFIDESPLPASPAILKVCFDLDVPGLFTGMPGDGTNIRLEISPGIAQEGTVPVPFAEQLQQYIDDNDGKFQITTLEFKHF